MAATNQYSNESTGNCIEHYVKLAECLSRNDENLENAFVSASVVLKYSEFSIHSHYDNFAYCFFCHLCGLEYPECHIMIRFRVRRAHPHAAADTVPMQFVCVPIDCPCIHRVNRNDRVTNVITRFVNYGISHRNTQTMDMIPPTVFADTKQYPESMIEDYCKVICLSIDLLNVKEILDCFDILKTPRQIIGGGYAIADGIGAPWIEEMITEACCSGDASNVKPASR
jgi:hypothetical protein